MSRFQVSCWCVAAIVLSGHLARAVVPLEKAPPPTPAQALQVKLAKLVIVPEIEANSPLKDVVGFLGERFDLTILIDSQSFVSDAMIIEPESQPIKLPAQEDVPLRDVLHKVAYQCGARCVQRGGLLMIVATDWAQASALAQPVDLACKERSLERVLKDLTVQTGYAIELDVRAAAAAQPITLKLTDVPLKSAVRLVADMADLDMVVYRDTIHVTTRAKARALAARARAEQPADPNADRPDPNQSPSK